MRTLQQQGRRRQQGGAHFGSEGQAAVVVDLGRGRPGCATRWSRGGMEAAPAKERSPNMEQRPVGGGGDDGDRRRGLVAVGTVEVRVEGKEESTSGEY